MKFETLLTQFEDLKEMVDDSQPEPHLNHEMREQLSEFEVKVNRALSLIIQFNLTKEQVRKLKSMVRYIEHTKADIRSSLEEFNEGIRDYMYPDRFEDPQDPFDY